MNEENNNHNMKDFFNKNENNQSECDSNDHSEHDPYETYGCGYTPYDYNDGDGGFFAHIHDISSATDTNTYNSSKFVSKKAFVALLILAMFVSCIVTFGLVKYFFDNGGSDSPVSATHYTLQKATKSQKSVEEVVAQNSNAVVEIQTESMTTDSFLSGYIQKGAGSGIIIDSRGYILTCFHVVNGASNIKVRLKNGKEYIAQLIGGDSRNDIAVIKISGGNFKAAQYGDSSSIAVGSMAVAIGNPLGELGGSASAGIISALDREVEIEGVRMTLLQTDTAINPGNSGGGLFDGNGNLIGVVVAKSGGSNIEGLGFAIPINKAAKIAKDLIENGKVSNRAVLGISVMSINDGASAKAYNLENGGVIVSKINSQNAKNAGFKEGDIIIKFEEKPIKDITDLYDALEGKKPGDKVKITVSRKGKTIVLTSVLGSL